MDQMDFMGGICYNTSWHSTIKTTPFKVVYNRERLLLRDYLPSTIWVEAVGQELTQRDQKLRELKEHIKYTQECMTKISDGKHRKHEFDVGKMSFPQVSTLQAIFCCSKEEC